MKISSKLDRRIQRTQQLLLNALIELILAKGYDSITVQDIIDRANVGRSTFYSHFRDKEQLLLSGFENLRDMLEAVRPSAENTYWDFSLALFQHIEENRQVFKAVLGKQAGNVVMKHFQKNLTIFLRNHFQMMYSTNNAPVPLDLFVQYFISTFLGLLTWWLDNDSTFSAMQMNDYFRKLTEPSILMMTGST